MLEESPSLEVLHFERAGPEIPNRTSILSKRCIALPNLCEARFLVFDPKPMNFQCKILECATIPSFVEILFLLPQSDKKDLYRLRRGFLFCDNVTDIAFISTFEDNPCAAMKLHSKTKLTIQTNAEGVASYLPSLGAQFPHLMYAHPLSKYPWGSTVASFRPITQLVQPYHDHDLRLYRFLCYTESHPFTRGSVFV